MHAATCIDRFFNRRKRPQIGQNQRKGFTLVELLVVIAIIGILIAILVPAIQAARASARRTQCANNMRQIGLALTMFDQQYDQLPPAVWHHPSHIAPEFFQQGYPQDDSYYFTWLTRILPFMEQGALYDKIDFDGSPWLNPGLPTPEFGYINGFELNSYKCPANLRNNKVEHDFGGGRKTSYAFTNYLGVNGTDQFARDGLIYVNSTVKLSSVSRSDGTANTLMVGERPPVYDGWYGWWFAGAGVWPWFGAVDSVLGTEEIIADATGRCWPTGPSRSDYQKGTYSHVPDVSGWDKHAWHFWSNHRTGSNFVYADGHVDFITYEVDPIVFRAQGTRRGGEY